MRVIIFFLCLFSEVSAINILLFLIGTTHFERGVFEYLAQQLALRNHYTVTVKPILIPEESRLVKQKLHLVHEKTLNNLLPRHLFEPLEAIGNDFPWRRGYETEQHLFPYYAAHVHACKKMLNSNLMETLKKDQIDVAIVYAGNPCQLAIVHALHIPFIYFDVEGFTDETRVASGTPLNADIPPSQCHPPTSPVIQRIANGLCILREYAAQSGFSWLASRVSERYARMDGPIGRLFVEDYELKKKFPNFPDVNEIKQNAELYFINSDRLIEYEHALLPHVIPIAGLHIDQVKPLFHPWNTSIASAEKGTIVVSLGTQANSSSMTLHQARSILGALSRLTAYRIFWRIGPTLYIPGVNLDHIPSYINVTSFIPQNDLLADRRTRLLITNGGMQSIIEAIVHGVPIVGIPLYGTNRQNLDKVYSKGFGLIVTKDRLSESTLYTAIKEVLESSKYKTVAKNMAREWKDRPQSAFQTALHYIEHVGRHRRALFIGVPHRSMHWARMMNIDLLAVLFLAATAPLLLAYRLVATSITASYRYKSLKAMDAHAKRIVAKRHPIEETRTASTSSCLLNGAKQP
uniref:glucuronosyltransferase n=1 Tax=Ascaris lumbricoides TaxID=6252 RepID=A0A9J2PB87_ASCLU